METMLLFAVLSGAVLLSVFRHRFLFSTRIVSLAVVMALLGCFTTTNLLAQETSGICGTNLTWEYDASTQTLTISGTGAMYDYKEIDYSHIVAIASSSAPWNGYSVKTIIVRDGVTVIGSGAFWGMAGVDKVILPKTLEEIRELAFYGTGIDTLDFKGDIYDYCGIELHAGIYLSDGSPMYQQVIYSWDAAPTPSKLYIEDKLIEDLVIPMDIKEIPSFPFRGCASIRSVKFSGDKLGGHAFESCVNLESVDLRGVAEIGGSAFSKCTRIKKMYLSNDIKFIYNEAFSDAKIEDCMYEGDLSTWLTDISFEDNPISVANNFYINDELLTHLVLPEGVSVINSRVFAGYDRLQDITFPKSLHRIGESAFEACSNLKEIGWNKVDTIESYAFSETGLEEVSLPVADYVGSFAFNKCISLTSVKFKSVNFFAKGVFAGCENLQECRFDGNIQDWLELDFESEFSNPLYYVDNLYINGELVEELQIPEGVESISDYAFAGYDRLKSVSLPKSLISIQVGAFAKCTGLQSVDFSENLYIIESSAFDSCISLSVAILPDNPINDAGWAFRLDYRAFADCSNLRYVSFPKTLVDIKPSVFENCISLDSVEFPDLARIDDCAFKGCVRISELFLPQNLVHLGSSAFEDCVGIANEVVIPASLRTFGDAAFRGCSSVPGCVVLGDTLSSMGACFFEGASNLRYVKLPKCVSSSNRDWWWNSVFKDCSKLEDVCLPENLKWIGYSMFENCYSLDSLWLPLALKEINNNAFRGANVYWLYLPPKLEYIDGVLCSAGSIQHVYYDIADWEGSMEADIPDWQTLEIEVGENVRMIGNRLFQDCEKMKSVDLSHVKEIGVSAFENCSNLESINYFSDSLRILGEAAFSGCKKLRGDIIIPDSITEINPNVFNGCLMLSGMTLPPTTKRIDATAFTDNVNLKHFTVYSLEPPMVENQESFENVDCPLRVPCMGAGIYRINEDWEHFKDNIEEISPYRLVLRENNEAYGSAVVTTPATCESDIVTVSAVPAPQCHFVCWRNRAGDNLSEANPYVFTITSDLTLIAEFRSDADTAVLYMVDYELNPAGGRISVECEGETVNPGDRLESGSILELRSIANEGYDFVKWWDGETKASRDYYLDENLEISATFRKDSQDTTGGLCVVEFNPEPAGGRIMVECEGEKVNPGDRLASGSILELRAIADEGYRFVEWWDGETKARRDYELEEDVEISALFQKETAVENRQSEFCRIWPNPTEGRFYVELGTAAGMEVLSANGMVVRPLVELPAGRHEIDLDGQASGVYFLRLTSSQENRVFKILLQR